MVPINGSPLYLNAQKIATGIAKKTALRRLSSDLLEFHGINPKAQRLHRQGRDRISLISPIAPYT